MCKLFRGDFNIKLEEEDQDCNAFYLIQKACMKLAEVSYQANDARITQTHRSKPLYQNFLFSRMLWSEYVLVLIVMWVHFTQQNMTTFFITIDIHFSFHSYEIS